MTAGMARSVEIGYSYRGLNVLAAGALALAAGAAWVLTAWPLGGLSPATLIVAACGVFYGALGVALLLYRRRLVAPVVTLTPAGFKDRRLTTAPIPWSAIRAIRSKTDERTLARYVVLWIDPAAAEAAGPTPLAHCTTPSSRHLGLDRLFIGTDGLAAGHDEFERVLRSYAMTAPA